VYALRYTRSALSTFNDPAFSSGTTRAAVSFDDVLYKEFLERTDQMQETGVFGMLGPVHTTLVSHGVIPRDAADRHRSAQRKMGVDPPALSLKRGESEVTAIADEAGGSGLLAIRSQFSVIASAGSGKTRAITDRSLKSRAVHRCLEWLPQLVVVPNDRVR